MNSFVLKSTKARPLDFLESLWVKSRIPSILSICNNIHYQYYNNNLT